MKRIHPQAVALTAIVLGLALPAASKAQESSVLQGRVLDATTGQPLIGAQIAVLESDLGAVTDVDGRYRLGLPVGSYDLRVVYLGFTNKTVTDVSIEAGRSNFLDISLQPEAIEADAIEVVISAAEERGSVLGALAHQRRATNVVNGISAEEIARAPASSAADAITRVQSASIVDGRYVYVRGLGERYSTAQLDGSSLPTPEPEKRVLPLDIFPAGMIESLFTVKSYTADLPGDFAGGLVDIRTKDIPHQPFLSFSTGLGYNTNLSGLDRPSYAGGGLDWLGFDDGTRNLPAGFPDDIPATASREEVANLHGRFEGDFRTTSESFDFGDTNKSFGLSFGAPAQWFSRDAGYLLGVSYSHSANVREQEEFYPALEEGRFQYDYDTRLGIREVSLGVTGSAALDPTPTSRLSWKTIFTQTAEDEARFVSGPFDQSTTGFGRITRFQFVERSLFSTKLLLDHKTGFLGDGKLSWDGSYALALRNEPDTRQSAYVAPTFDSDEFFFNEAGNNSRFFSELTDHLMQGGVELASGFDFLGRRTTLDAGARGGYRTRDFGARRFSYEGASPEGRRIPAARLFTSENIRLGNIQFLDDTQPNDEYDGTERSAAGYASLGIGLTDDVRLTAGMRVEWNETEVLSFNPRAGDRSETLRVDLGTVEPLPTLTLQWQATDEQSVRIAASRTIVRPQFRELAPFRYDNYLESTLGNPFLGNGEIYNVDARWALFPSPGEVLSIGGFYKVFNDPIEIVRLPTGGNNVGTPEPYNAPRAETYGVEVEVRHDLARWIPLAGLGLSANAALAESEVVQDEPVEVFFGGGSTATLLNPEVFSNPSRPLFGQSPYLVNASLHYTTGSAATQATLLYNAVGERLAEVGTNNFDDIYEQARHTLDATLDQRLWSWVALKVSASNLTDEPFEFRLGDDVTRRYRPGRSLAIKASYSF
ncbi:MAG TPA: TonB-dependent receptor [Gemmatimonadota bacterium]|nr:TonB-dependent receptor [Gemmatimonadota bacterium]